VKAYFRESEGVRGAGRKGCIRWSRLHRKGDEFWTEVAKKHQQYTPNAAAKALPAGQLYRGGMKMCIDMLTFYLHHDIRHAPRF
jgi:hypothetical protein